MSGIMTTGSGTRGPTSRPLASADPRPPASADPRPPASADPRSPASTNRRARLAEVASAVRRRFPAAVAGSVGHLPVRSTGIACLDALLPGGGLPLGRITLLCGAPSSGRTGLALAALASATAAGETAAWIDGPGTFHPPSAAAAGVDLARLLLVQPPAGSRVEALHAATLLLRTGSLALLLLDVTSGAGGRLPPESLARLGRSVAAGSACLVLTDDRPTPGLLQLSALALRLDRRACLWEGAAGDGGPQAPRTLGGLTLSATLFRSRLGGEGRQADLTLLRSGGIAP
jgi:hypothetical protein